MHTRTISTQHRGAAQTPQLEGNQPQSQFGWRALGRGKQQVAKRVLRAHVKVLGFVAGKDDAHLLVLHLLDEDARLGQGGDAGRGLLHTRAHTAQCSCMSRERRAHGAAALTCLRAIGSAAKLSGGPPDASPRATNSHRAGSSSATSTSMASRTSARVPALSTSTKPTDSERQENESRMAECQGHASALQASRGANPLTFSRTHWADTRAFAVPLPRQLEDGDTHGQGKKRPRIFLHRRTCLLHCLPPRDCYHHPSKNKEKWDEGGAHTTDFSQRHKAQNAM